MFNSKLIKVISFTFIFKIMVLGILLIPWAATCSQGDPMAIQNQECIICLSSAQELGAAQARLTNCCKQFICKKDADALQSQAQANHRQNGGEQHARCPNCRNYPLIVNAPAQQIRQQAQMPAPSAPARNMPQPSAPARSPRSAPARSENSARRAVSVDNALADQQLRIWLAAQPNAKKCPTPQCTYAFINERAASPHTFMCPVCHCDYCSHCLIAHDSQISCLLAAERLTKWMQLHLDNNVQVPAPVAQQHAPIAMPAAPAVQDMQDMRVELTARAYSTLMNLPSHVRSFQANFQSLMNRVRSFLNQA